MKNIKLVLYSEELANLIKELNTYNRKNRYSEHHDVRYYLLSKLLSFIIYGNSIYTNGYYVEIDLREEFRNLPDYLMEMMKDAVESLKDDVYRFCSFYGIQFWSIECPMSVYLFEILSDYSIVVEVTKHGNVKRKHM